MNSNVLFILELIIFNGAVLAWATYEFLSVRRSRKKTESAAGEAGHAEGQHAADDGAGEPRQ